jgi:hypothetical protein
MRATRQAKKGEPPSSALETVNRLTHQSSCTFFQWAEFDDDGEPPWAKKAQNELASK